jgi:aspartate aminotransferase
MAEQMSQRVQAFYGATRHVFEFLTESTYSRRQNEPGISNFAIGNPHEMPLTRFVEALQQNTTPQNKDWYAYKLSERPSQEIVAATLRESRGLSYEPDDILMTNGAFAALSVALNALTDPGDEVIFISPPWFFYEALIVAVGAAPVRVKVNMETFDLDVDAIAAAITPKTRAIIVNSPNNPTGKIYPPETLRQLAAVLTEAGARYGRTIYLLSDEAYSRIVYDGAMYDSPAKYYPNTLLLYTYGKTLLTPGQRLGYIAVHPSMHESESVRMALFVGQIIVGYAFPNALLQHSLSELEKLSIDIEHLQEKRDWMVDGLRRMGYEVHVPQGTFYLLPRAPIADDLAFTEMLAQQDVLCLPGTIVEMPGYFRISLTANDEMIERGLPGFERALKAALERV